MQVNDLESSDSMTTQATSLGYLHYPPPAVFVANFHSADRMSFFADLVYSPFFSLPAWDLNRPVSRIEQQDMVQNVGSVRTQVGSSASTHVQPDANIAQHGFHSGSGRIADSSLPSDPMQLDATEIDDMQPNDIISSRGQESVRNQNNLQTTEFGQLQPALPSGDGAHWELPFLQGGLIGQSQFGLPARPVLNGGNREHSAQFTSSSSHDNGDPMISFLAMPGSASRPVVSGRSTVQHRFADLFSIPESNNVSPPVSLSESGDPQLIINRVQSELAASLAATTTAELPCTVKLRVWSHDMIRPSAPLTPERCRLIIPHAVLCRYVDIWCCLF